MEYWAAGIVTGTILVLSLALHEMGHAWFGRWVGLVPRHISLSLFGGVTVFDREPETPRAACQVALAALAAILAHVALVECDADPLAAGVAASAAVINADRIRRRRPQTDRGAALAFARARAVAAGVAAPRNFASGQAAGSVSRASTPPLAGAASVRVPPCRRAIRSTVTSPIPVRPGF